MTNKEIEKMRKKQQEIEEKVVQTLKQIKESDNVLRYITVATKHKKGVGKEVSITFYSDIFEPLAVLNFKEDEKELTLINYGYVVDDILTNMLHIALANKFNNKYDVRTVTLYGSSNIEYLVVYDKEKGGDIAITIDPFCTWSYSEFGEEKIVVVTFYLNFVLEEVSNKISLLELLFGPKLQHTKMKVDAEELNEIELTLNNAI